MTPLGQSLRIYLADGNPTGIRWAEIVNWTGQAVACPRIRLAELASWAEVKKPGVYFLLQGGLNNDKGEVYIGESENVFGRLNQQTANHEFWTEAVAFTNKDDNLTKSHVRYLEARLIELAQQAQRYSVHNATIGTLAPVLPRPDKAAMEAFLVNLRLVLSSLGHRVLEPLTQSGTSTNQPAQVSQVVQNPLATKQLSFTTAGLTAKGYVTDEGFTLLQNSQVSKGEAEKIPNNVRLLRAAALENGELHLEGNHYRLTADKSFTSPSAAACFVTGYSVSGPQSWQHNGVSLKMLEQQLLQLSIDAASVDSEETEISELEATDSLSEE